jgi:oligopeptide/dipeptide ABC transporter ATP-binding protein
MYLGALVEVATSVDIYREPLHPYTIALLSAVPVTSPRDRERRRRIILLGDVPSPVNPPSGCRFHTRCWLRKQLGNPERCATERPELRILEPDHEAACHFAEELLPGPGRDRLVADAARGSSAFDTAEDEVVAAPGARPPTDSGGLFDTSEEPSDEETRGRLG